MRLGTHYPGKKRFIFTGIVSLLVLLGKTMAILNGEKAGRRDPGKGDYRRKDFYSYPVKWTELSWIPVGRATGVKTYVSDSYPLYSRLYSLTGRRHVVCHRPRVSPHSCTLSRNSFRNNHLRTLENKHGMGAVRQYLSHNIWKTVYLM